MSTVMDTCRRSWPRIGAVAAMAPGGASALVSTGRGPGDVRALAVMNSIAMPISDPRLGRFGDPGPAA